MKSSSPTLVSDPALIQALTVRRFELGNRPDAYVFGTKDGKRVLGFRRMWTELFTLAGLDWGRDKGLVWHTARHEAISRALEAAEGDIGVTQQYGPPSRSPDDRRLRACAAWASAGNRRAPGNREVDATATG